MSDMSEAVALYYEKKYKEALQSLEKSDQAFKVHYGYMELMGSIYGGLMDVEKSDFYFKKALSVSPSAAPVLNNWGIAKEKMGDLSQAEMMYAKAIQADENYIHAYNNLASLYLNKKSFNKSREVLNVLNEKFPNYALGYVSLGNLEKKEGQIQKALNAYQKAMELNPKILDSFLNSCVTLIEMGKLNEAQNICNIALEHHPFNQDVLLKLGVIFKKKLDYKNALKVFSEISERNPKCCVAYEQMSTCFYHLNQYQMSVDTILRLMENNPEYQNAEIYVQMADSYSKMKNINLAEKCYQKAFDINPDSEMLKNNHAIFLIDRGEKKQPDFNGGSDISIYNSSLNLLKSAKSEEEFRSAWRGYEKRWRTEEYAGRYLKVPLPVWNGQPLDGDGRVLIWGEQGIGDLVLFLSLIPKVLERKIKISFFIDERLHSTVLRSFPDQEIEIFDPKSAIKTDIKAHIPIGSLCGLYLYPPFEKNPKSYLKADENAVAYFKKKFNLLKEKTGAEKIFGFSWKTKNKNVSMSRNIDLNHWDLFLKEKKIAWINLQYGDFSKSEIEILNKKNIFVENVDPLKELDLFFALITALDGIISSDNSTVHFSGALGMPTQVLIPEQVDWKWKIGSSDRGSRTIWYPRLNVLEKNNTMKELIESGLDFLWSI